MYLLLNMPLSDDQIDSELVYYKSFFSRKRRALMETYARQCNIPSECLDFRECGVFYKSLDIFSPIKEIADQLTVPYEFVVNLKDEKISHLVRGNQKFGYIFLKGTREELLMTRFTLPQVFFDNDPIEMSDEEFQYYRTLNKKVDQLLKSNQSE